MMTKTIKSLNAEKYQTNNLNMYFSIINDFNKKAVLYQALGIGLMIGTLMIV
jgi:hypothetical protein